VHQRDHTIEHSHVHRIYTDTSIVVIVNDVMDASGLFL
jgi:hypothetical protein